MLTATQAIFERGMSLLGADTTTLNKTSTSRNQMILFQNNVAPGRGQVIGDFVEADFTGYNPVEIVEGPMPQTDDPATGDALVTFPPVAGGFTFTTTGTTSLPQTIYGFAIVDDAKTVVYAAGLLEDPVTLTGSGQTLVVPTPQLRLLQNGLI